MSDDPFLRALTLRLFRADSVGRITEPERLFDLAVFDLGVLWEGDLVAAHWSSKSATMTKATTQNSIRAAMM